MDWRSFVDILARIMIIPSTAITIFVIAEVFAEVLAKQNITLGSTGAVYFCLLVTALCWAWVLVRIHWK